MGRRTFSMPARNVASQFVTRFFLRYTCEPRRPVRVRTERRMCQGKPLFELGLPKRPVPTGAPVLPNKGILTGR